MKENKLMIQAAYGAARRYLDYLIAATPTGNVRVILTESNIQLMRAEQEWEHGLRTAKDGHTSKTVQNANTGNLFGNTVEDRNSSVSRKHNRGSKEVTKKR